LRTAIYCDLRWPNFAGRPNYKGRKTFHEVHDVSNLGSGASVSRTVRPRTNKFGMATHTGSKWISSFL